MRIGEQAPEKLMNEKRLLKKIVKPLICSHTPKANQAQVLLSAAWFVQELNNVADHKGDMGVLYIYFLYFQKNICKKWN